MVRIVELDGPTREKESTVYVVNVGEEKVGVSQAELIELIRAKHARTAGRRTPAPRAGRAPENDAGAVDDGIANGSAQ